MCQACEAYEEVMEALSTFELTNDQGVELLANMIQTFTGDVPVKIVLMLGILNTRVFEQLSSTEETGH